MLVAYLHLALKRQLFPGWAERRRRVPNDEPRLQAWVLKLQYSHPNPGGVTLFFALSTRGMQLFWIAVGAAMPHVFTKGDSIPYHPCRGFGR
jgi:hypothetical protein